jgi:Arc/MetJ family transcription regulator
MRTNIEIDDELLSDAMTASGQPTKKATVEEGLRLLVQVRRQSQALADIKGLGWDGDLDRMRRGGTVAEFK